MIEFAFEEQPQNTQGCLVHTVKAGTLQFLSGDDDWTAKNSPTSALAETSIFFSDL